jgi:CheY-specific phosphatase CheX
MSPEIAQRNEVMAAELVGAARDVLNVMFFTDILEESERESEERPPAIGVRVDFSGDATGEFRMEVDAGTAEAMAGSFLGAEAGAGVSDLEVDQVMGELGNMVCGAFLSRFEQEGLFALSSPEVRRPAERSRSRVYRALLLEDGWMDLRVNWGPAAE